MTRQSHQASRREPPDPRRSQRSSLLRPGGNVDPEALRAAALEEEETGEDGSLRQVSFRLSRDLRKRLDQYLTDRIPFISRSQAQRLIASESVHVNGRLPKASTVLRAGDLVEAVIPPPASSDIEPEQIPIDVLYEDDDLLVLNKSPDIIVHPARSHLSGTLVNAVAWHVLHGSDGDGALSNVGAECARPGVVHRLDRQTSGVIVFAKRDEAHWKLARQFERRTVDKRYIAVAQGRMEPIADVVDLPIGPHTSNLKGLREKCIVRYDELGKNAVTIYRTRELYQDASLLEIELRTGRTHQIRVHMSHIGHPLLGDDMYGGRRLTRGDLLPDLDEAQRAEDLFTRQALHAAMISFDHPVTGRRLSFSAPVPLDMARLIAILRTHHADAGACEAGGGALDLDAVIGDVGCDV